MTEAAARRGAPPRLAVLASGRGSHLRAIAADIAAGRLAAQLVLVASDRPESAAVQWAREQGMAVFAEDSRRAGTREAWDARLSAALAAAAPDWVVLAGFMRILSGQVIEPWATRMINIHPSLLPRYPGLHTHARALAAGDREHGASVHFVTAELDAGPVLMQTRISIRGDDDPQSLALRLLPQEHGLMAAALQLLVSGRVAIQDGTIILDARPLSDPINHVASS